MMPPLSIKVAAIIALLVPGPAIAETAGRQTAASVAQIADFVSGVASTAWTGAASAAEGTAVKFIPQVKPPAAALGIHQDPIDHVIQPIRSLAQIAADLIASTADAAVIATKRTNQWIADRADCVATAAHNTSDWITARSNAVVLAVQDTEKWLAQSAIAARNTKDWVASTSSTVVFAAQDTGAWITTSSIAAANLAISAASHTFRAFSTLEDWSANLVRHVEGHLRADPTSEFSLLVKESGFAMSDVKVGIGLIPDLTVEFRHERDLEPAETQALKVKIDAYAKTVAGPVGYFEAHLLGRLLKAGEYAGEMRINEVHVDVFPLPGLQVFFDPLSFEAEQNKMLTDAYNEAEADAAGLKSVEDRVSKIEALLFGGARQATD